MQFPILFIKFYKGEFLQFERKYGIVNTCTCSWIVKIVSHKCLAVSCCVSIKDNKILGPNMSRSVYRYNVSLCYLCVSLTVSVVSVKRQEVTETAKSVTETSRTNRNFTMAVLYSSYSDAEIFIICSFYLIVSDMDDNKWSRQGSDSDSVQFCMTL